jgi:hypothetical protein
MAAGFVEDFFQYLGGGFAERIQSRPARSATIDCSYKITACR